MISCYQLTIPRRGEGAPLFDEVTFEIDPGTWVEFTGPAGCGKSLLFSFLSLQKQPVQGKLIVAGRNLSRVGPDALPAVRRRIGSCRQSVELLEERSVIENVLLPFVARGQHDGAAQAAADILKAADMLEMRDERARYLPAAKRRLLGILRAVVTTPELVLIDGGLEGLPAAEAEAAVDALRRLHDDGATVILFQRDPGEHRRAGVEFRIDDGNIIRRDPSSEIPQVQSGAA